jgi:inosine-uridine nucleoside N-ribohydrolase
MRGLFVVLIVSALAAFLGGACTMAAEPVRLIFDTDIGNDVDDVLALGVIHALQSRGQCELLAVTITKDNPLAAEFVDAVNTFYGRGDIPIGVVHSGITKDEGKFLGLARVQGAGVLRYPHDLDGTRAPAATEVLRQVLSQQPDRSVAIAQVGFSTNLAALLASPADAISPLSGVELVRHKVRLLSVMAGNFARDPGTPRPLEYNVINDIPACTRLMQDWPTEIVMSGFEIGIAVPYPAVSIERDYSYVPHHPLAEAYCLYDPPPHNRPTWDLTSVLYAVFPDRGYFDLSPPGRVTIEADGSTRWEAQDNGPHRYLQINAVQVARVTEALVQLSSQPPQK